MKTIIIGFICGFLKIPKTHKKEVRHDKLKIQNFLLTQLLTSKYIRYFQIYYAIINDHLILFYKLFPMLITSISAIF